MDIIQTLQRLFVLDELNNLQRQITEAVEKGYGAGKITLTLSYKLARVGVRTSNGERVDAVPEIQIQPEVTGKVPEPGYASRVFFVGDDHELHVDHPRQRRLSLEHSDPQTPPATQDATGTTGRRIAND